MKLNQRTINSSLHLFTGSFKLGLGKVVSVVLSEDGTEIDEDELLMAYAGKPFLLLEDGQVWSCEATPADGM